MRIYQKFPTLFLVFVFLIGFSAAKAQVDPDIQWKTMSLPHFDLIYDAKHQALADLYADRLEDNLGYLQTYFEHFPEKTTVILNDRTDLTNGYATPLPYRTMMLFPVLPGPSETISEYGDWARELTMHEMTHILSFEPRRGVVKGLYYIFGNIITPNLLLPRWWLEGVAVDLETRTSSKGRLRSVAQDASLRAYVLDDSLKNMNVSEINEVSIYTWPQGGRPYLFGSYMWSDLISRYGSKIVKDLHWRYGGRIPFLIEGPFSDLTGESYSSYFRNVKNDLQQRAEKQIQILNQQKLSEGSPFLVKNSIEAFFPLISPNGKNMIFLSKSDSGKRSAVILQRGSLDIPFDDSQRLAKIDQKMEEEGLAPGPIPRNEHEDSPPSGAIQRLAWFPNSTKFIFDQVQELDRFRETSDLYTFDLSTSKRERLTTGERAREASVSLDGNKVVFVKLDAGRMHLAILDLATKQVQVIYSPDLQVRLSWPLFLNENEILFAERSQGTEILKKISLSNKSISAVLPAFTEAKYPTLTSMGLIFNSNKNGVSNLYIADSKLTSAKALSHTGTGLAAASFDSHRQEIYAAQLTSSGFQIKRFDKNNWNQYSKDLPQIQPLLADRYPAVEPAVKSTDKTQIEEYSAWPYMYPRYWLPNFSFDQNGSLFGANVAANDPLGKHSYSLAAAYDSRVKESAMAGIYTNNSTRAQISLYGLDYYTNIINTPTRFRHQQYQAQALWQILPLSTDLYSGFGYRWSARSFAQTRREQNGPAFILTYQDYVQSGAQISPESGQAIGLQATEFVDNGAGENEAFRLYQYSLQKYFSGWISHHAVMMRAQGQYIDGVASSPNYAYNLALAPFANLAGGGVVAPFFIARGWENGQFLGKNLNTANLEYRFPIKELRGGFSDTTPLFLRRIHGALVADGANVNGFVYRQSTERYETADSQKIFWSAGAELKFDLTLGYHIPATFYFGYYVPQDRDFVKKDAYAISLQL